MYTTKLWIRSALTLSLVAVLAGYSLAKQSDNQTTNQTTIIIDQSDASRSASQQDTSGSQMGADLHRASKLIGSPVKTVQGQKIGTVYELVLTPEMNNVSYAVVSTGGLFGMGRQLHAIPWSTIQTGVDGAIAVPISVQEFEEDRGFPSDRWPSEGNPRWLSRAGERTEEVTYDVATAADQKSIQQRRFSRVKGMTVKGPEDRNVGSVQDLVVATDTGRIPYTIISFGGLIGMGEKYSAVPMSAVNFNPQQRIARVEVSEQALQAYAFAPDAFPNLSDPLYAQRLHSAYGIEGYDTVLGYVPAEEPAKQPTAPRTTQPAPSTGRTEAIEIGSGAMFDPAAVKTIQGVVTTVGKFARTGADSDRLLLKVQADNGAMYNVFAGPLDYVSKQDFYAVNGDRVNVTGAPVQAGQHSVILASQISKDGQTLQLRDKDGKPLWEHQVSPKPQSGATTSPDSGQSSGEASEPTHEHESETPTP